MVNYFSKWFLINRVIRVIRLLQHQIIGAAIIWCCILVLQESGDKFDCYININTNKADLIIPANTMKEFKV